MHVDFDAGTWTQEAPVDGQAASSYAKPAVTSELNMICLIQKHIIKSMCLSLYQNSWERGVNIRVEEVLRVSPTAPRFLSETSDSTGSAERCRDVKRKRPNSGLFEAFLSFNSRILLITFL